MGVGEGGRSEFGTASLERVWDRHELARGVIRTQASLGQRVWDRHASARRNSGMGRVWDRHASTCAPARSVEGDSRRGGSCAGLGPTRRGTWLSFRGPSISLLRESIAGISNRRVAYWPDRNRVATSVLRLPRRRTVHEMHGVNACLSQTPPQMPVHACPKLRPKLRCPNLWIPKWSESSEKVPNFEAKPRTPLDSAA